MFLCVLVLHVMCLFILELTIYVSVSLCSFEVGANSSTVNTLQAMTSSKTDIFVAMVATSAWDNARPNVGNNVTLLWFFCLVAGCLSVLIVLCCIHACADV